MIVLKPGKKFNTNRFFCVLILVVTLIFAGSIVSALDLSYGTSKVSNAQQGVTISGDNGKGVTYSPTINPTIIPAKSRYGSIYVSSSPPGASVYLDGTYTKRVTPTTITSVTAGSHTVRCAKIGYPFQSQTVTVYNGQIANVPFTFDREIIVPDPEISASFNYNPSSGNPPLIVYFRDQSTGNPTSWDWDFGDGTSHAYSKTTSHTYTKSGSYTVTLTASNSGGSSTVSTYYPIEVGGSVPPVANFNYNPTSGNPPLIVYFRDQSTGNPTSWDWNFGDGTAHSYSQNPTHTYTKTGSYTVSLTAYNSGGSNTISTSNPIKVGSVPLVANFNYNPASGNTPLFVSFTDTSTGNPTSWDWNFGDGTAHSYSQNPTHTYTKTGSYTVTLTASNSFGSRTASTINPISVMVEGASPPVASFKYNPTSGNIPLTVSFTDTSTGNPTSWDWNFGEGGITPHAYSQNPTHIYTKVGPYTVTLTVSNSVGSSTATTINPISVKNSMGALWV